MTTPTSEVLQVELAEGGVAQVWLDRPKVGNALSSELLRAFEETLAWASAEEVRALVLRGCGAHFCAGGDVAEMRAAFAGLNDDGEAAKAKLRELSVGYGRLLAALSTLRVPVIAVAHGATRGGGVGLLCVADIVLATEGASFALPEVRLGVPPTQVAPWLSRRVGRAQARRLMLSGRTVEATEARALGLVHELAADAEDLEQRLRALVRDLLGGGPEVLGRTKSWLEAVVPAETEPDSDELIERAADEFVAGVTSAEGREGLAALNEKRRPAWAPSKQ